MWAQHLKVINFRINNIDVVCPSISIYVQNCYTLPSRFFIIGGTEIKSSEGTTQGDPVAIPIYALSVKLPVVIVLETTNTKTNSGAEVVAYADDFSAAGSTLSLKYWWDTLCILGPKFGYFPEPTKSLLIVKSDCCNKAIHTFKDKRHLGVALGTSQFRDEYIMEKINKWVEELHVLSKIAKI